METAVIVLASLIVGGGLMYLGIVIYVATHWGGH